MPDEWLDHLLDHIVQVSEGNGWKAEDVLDELRIRLAERDIDAAEAASDGE